MDKFLSSNLSLNLNGFPPGPGEKYCWGSITLDVSVWLVSLGMDPRSYVPGKHSSAELHIPSPAPAL